MAAKARQRLTLSSNWRWKLADSNNANIPAVASSLAEWHPASTVPSVIQLELLHQDIIPEPNIGENERRIQWVSEVDWQYGCSFPTPAWTAGLDHVVLVFEGLDTFATVELNGKEVLKSDNMFLPQEVQIKDILAPPGQDNELSVLFESVIKKGAQLESEHGVRTSLWRGTKRMHVRKAQCHWGWDAAPTVLTAGPYLPIHLEGYSTRIVDPHIQSTISQDHKHAQVTLVFGVGNLKESAQITARILNDKKQLVATANRHHSLRDASASVTLEIPDPELWWPHGHGAQPLYHAEIALTDPAGKALDSRTCRFGIRTITLVQRPLKSAPGTTFMFNVNGRNIFSQGGNWVPIDTLLPRVQRERYFDWMKLAVFAHHNMVRVWGGGVYESEDFFDACDELGILVWHDFAFACGDYPLNAAFLKSVQLEAEAQVKRLRNRPSLALLCGGNEDFMLEDWKDTRYDHGETSGPFEDKPFPQRKIYLDILPQAVAEYAPNIHYWANSPWGGPDIANNNTIGDMHQWEVWHLRQLPYQSYPDIGGRFVSEFGMYGFPIERTISDFVPNPKDRHPQSRVMDCHNKGTEQEMRVARYMAENFRYDSNTLSNFVYGTQLMQSEALGYALRHWRRKFVPGREECAGILVWQINDIWPVVCWAYIDYFLRPKPAFYTIRRSFARISVGIARTPRTRFIDEGADIRANLIPTFEIFAHNNTMADVQCELRVQAFDWGTRKLLDLDTTSPGRRLTLGSNQNTELASWKDPSWTEDSLIVLEARLVSTAAGKPETILARVMDWPEPYRYLWWPDDTRVAVSVRQGAGGVRDDNLSWEHTVTVSSNHPVKGVWLEPVYDGQESQQEPEPLWEDNMFDLMPGLDNAVSVGVNGLRGRKVQARFLADWEIGVGLGSKL